MKLDINPKNQIVKDYMKPIQYRIDFNEIYGILIKSSMFLDESNFKANLIPNKTGSISLFEPIISINYKPSNIDYHKSMNEALLYLFDRNLNIDEIESEDIFLRLGELERELSKNFKKEDLRYIKNTWNSQRNLLNFLIRYKVISIIGEK